MTLNITEPTVGGSSGSWGTQLNDALTAIVAYINALESNAQPVDADLTAIAALTTTAYGRSLLTQANAAAAQTVLGLGSAATQATSAFDAAGAAATAQAAALSGAATDATAKANAAAAASQPLDSDLTAIAALTTTAFGRSFLDRADATAARTLLGLGGAATLSVGTATGTVAAGDDTRITGAVPATRTVNGKALTANITLTASDVGAQPTGNYAALPSTVVSKTSAYTAAANDFVQANATGGGFTVTLPTAPAVGAAVTVQKTDASANIVTVAPAAGGTINGDPNATIVARWAGAILEHLGSNAWAVTSVLNSAGPTGPTGPAGPAGGSGVQPTQAVGVIGSWYADPVPASGNSNQSIALGTMVMGVPTIAPEDLTIDQLGCYVQVAGGAGALVRLGLWTPSAGNPYRIALNSAYATLLADGGTATATTGGSRAIVTLGTPQVITKGTPFCVGVAVQGAGPVGIYCIGTNIWSGPWGTSGDTILNGARAAATATGVTGALPSTFTPTAYLGGGIGGAGWYHRSA